jgi:hypothetical protein
LLGYTVHAARVNGDEGVYGRLKAGLRRTSPRSRPIPSTRIPTSYRSCRCG